MKLGRPVNVNKKEYNEMKRVSVLDRHAWNSDLSSAGYVWHIMKSKIGQSRPRTV